jgi:hypothetical protein
MSGLPDGPGVDQADGGSKRARAFCWLGGLDAIATAVLRAVERGIGPGK